MIEVGDKIETWFSGEADGLSIVLAVEPYRGKFRSWFSHVLRVTAPRTKQGWLEITVGPNTAYRKPTDAQANVIAADTRVPAG